MIDIMKKIKYSRIAIVGSVYGLLVYLLYCKEREIDETFFVVDTGIPNDIAGRLNHKIRVSDFENRYSFLKNHGLDWLFYRIIRFYVPANKNAEYYSQDHLPSSPAILGNNCYIHIEDSPKHPSHFLTTPRLRKLEEMRKKKTYFIRKFLYGATYLWENGSGTQCKGLIMSEFDDAYYIHDKKKIVMGLQEAWKNASENKKNEILAIFGITENDKLELMKRPYIVFTNPLYPDYISLEDHKCIYRNIINKYPNDKIVIKPHPRDRVDYESLIPGVCVFKKIVPSQLLDLIGVKFNKAITVCSSAVKSFSYPIEIDWYGTGIHHDLEMQMGQTPLPDNAKLCIL